MEDLLPALKGHFGFDQFRKGQENIIRCLLNRRDTLAVMPTGGGKSICYQLPAVLQPGITIVITPLISLMKDQVDQLRRLKIPCGTIHSNQTPDEKREVFRQMQENEYFLLYLSPERAQKPGFQKWVREQKINFIAIDEAHCVSQWGADFRPDYYQLRIFKQLLPDVPIIALTASATPFVLYDIERQLGLKKNSRFVYGFYRPNLYLQIEECKTDEEKFLFVQEGLLKFRDKGKIIIYCGTRKNCEELYQQFKEAFPRSQFYHAGMNKDQRDQVQTGFESNDFDILFATNAFGMGIDIKNIRLVVHYQMPANVESYYQEIGRAGRDGLDSTALLLSSGRDKGLHGYFIRSSGAEKQELRRRWDALSAMSNFIEGGDCRHGEILFYFGDAQKIPRCGHCDICAPLSARKIGLPEFRSFKKVVKLRKATAKKSDAEKDAVVASEVISSGESTGDDNLRQILRNWRKEYAKQQELPAFMIFSNRTLEELVEKFPQTLEELEGIYGLGPAKIEKFGPQLQIILNEQVKV